MACTSHERQNIRLLPYVRIFGSWTDLQELFHYRPVFMAAVLIHLGRVATEHFHNNLPSWGCSVTYRSLVRFDAARIAPNHRVLLSYKS